MKTLFTISIAALVIAVGMSAYAYLELEEIKNIQRVSYEHTIKSLEHWEEFTMWELTHQDISQSQYQSQWKQYALDGLVMDEAYMNEMERLLYP